jgi:hypothetical protein
MKSAAYGVFLITSKVLDARRRGAMTEPYGAIRRKASGPQGLRPLRAVCSTSRKPEGGAIEGNTADDALLVDQGCSGYVGLFSLEKQRLSPGAVSPDPRGKRLVVIFLLVCLRP